MLSMAGEEPGAADRGDTADMARRGGVEDMKGRVGGRSDEAE